MLNNIHLKDFKLTKDIVWDNTSGFFVNIKCKCGWKFGDWDGKMKKCKNCGHKMYVSSLDSSCDGHIIDGEDFGEEKQKLKSIEKIVFGNGDDGFVKRLRNAETEIIKQKEKNSTKMWFYRSTIGVLIALVTFLATQLYNIKFGG